MKMKKIVILLLLLAACQFVPVQTTQRPPPEIMVGTSALDASFQSTSMSNIFMCQEANVYVNVRNSGAYDVRDGAYAFILEEQVLRPVGFKQNRFSLDGRSQFNPSGGLDQVNFKFKNVGLPEQLESYASPLIFQACYNYQTSATVPVCVDPDLQNLNSRKPCRVQPVGLSGGQGAPVAVTLVETFMIPEGNVVRPKFVVHVQHLGSGQVVSSENAVAACGVGAGRLRAEVNVYAELQGQPLTCTPSPVKLEPDKDSIFVCEREDIGYGLAEGTFTTFLHVELEYGYINTAVLPITITRIAGQEAC